MAKRATSKPANKPLRNTAIGTAEPQTPAEILGESPQVTLPPEVVQDAAGNSYEEGDLSEADILADEPGLVSDAEPAAEPHPAIELAQSFVTPHGVPDTPAHPYYTPPPPDLRCRAKKTR